MIIFLFQPPAPLQPRGERVMTTHLYSNCSIAPLNNATANPNGQNIDAQSKLLMISIEKDSDGSRIGKRVAGQIV